MRRYAAKKGRELKQETTLRLGAAIAAVAALAVIVGGGGAAAASTASKARPATIDMARDGKELFFEGAKTVQAGATLKIKNLTNPKQVGPHTFSLVRKQERPKTRNQIKACAKKLKGICGAIVKWHDVNVQTGEIGENPVEVGKNGWNLEGNLKRKGDSWVAERKNESFKREVTAKPGTTLHFICAVHPEMQGKIKVTG